MGNQSSNNSRCLIFSNLNKQYEVLSNGRTQITSPQNEVFIQLKKFEFSSTLKTMSVLSENSKTKEKYIFTKGAAERIFNLCVRWSIPPNAVKELNNVTSIYF